MSSEYNKPLHHKPVTHEGGHWVHTFISNTSPHAHDCNNPVFIPVSKVRSLGYGLERPAQTELQAGVGWAGCLSRGGVSSSQAHAVSAESSSLWSKDWSTAFFCQLTAGAASASAPLQVLTSWSSYRSTYDMAAPSVPGGGSLPRTLIQSLMEYNYASDSVIFDTFYCLKLSHKFYPHSRREDYTRYN